MKDILKMTSKQRCDYLSSLNVDEELVKANYFRIRVDNECLYPIKRLTALVNSSHKLFFGHNRAPGNTQEKFNYLMVHLIVFINSGLYEDFIKESE